jgi:DNA-binding Xre family transcriptional regulator
MMNLIVREVAERAGIRNALELANKTGLHYASIYRIWNGEARMISLDTLDKICTLLEVKPGQLFNHVAEPERLNKKPLPHPDEKKRASKK